MAAAEKADTQSATEQVSLDDLMSLTAFVRRYSDIANEPRARWWIFHRETNGLAKSGALVKRGGRWFFVVPKFRDWLIAGNGQGGDK